MSAADFDGVESVVKRLNRMLRALWEAREQLSIRAGVGWSSIPGPGDLPVDELDQRAGPASLDVDELTAGRAHALAGRLSAAAAMLEERRASLDRIAAMLAMPLSETFDDAANLLSLADIALSAERPEQDWLTGGTDAARRARGELASAASQLTDAEQRGSAFYLNAVLDHDIEVLCRRFATEHRGLRKLGGAYRRDKCEVASFSRDDVSKRDTLSHLDAAKAWKNAADTFRVAEQTHSSALGSYYTGRNTDFALLERPWIEPTRRPAAAPRPSGPVSRRGLHETLPSTLGLRPRSQALVPRWTIGAPALLRRPRPPRARSCSPAPSARRSAGCEASPLGCHRSGRPATALTSVCDTPTGQAYSCSASNATVSSTTRPKWRGIATGCANRCWAASVGGCTESGEPRGTATATGSNSGCAGRSRTPSCHQSAVW